MSSSDESKKVALVTGVSSGIGRAIASALAAGGYRVFGSVRKPTAEVPSGVERVTLDVRDQASVDSAVAEIVQRAGRIDVLVNNAGGTIVGAIEETDTAQAQALFDVNFFGAVRATQAVLPHMRRQKSGRVLFISSVVGFLPAPYMGFYAASKHALEGYAESLDHEVRKLGVRALLIEPGFIKTNIDQNAERAKHPIDAYADGRQRAGESVNASVQHGDAPELVASAVLATVESQRPRLRTQVGKNAGLLAKLRSFLPAGIFDRSLRKEFRLDA
jgi:NAD(P)-dependent dehydrogenase (short-subunit alcohol dehydrogenase family)